MITWKESKDLQLLQWKIHIMIFIPWVFLQGFLKDETLNCKFRFKNLVNFEKSL